MARDRSAKRCAWIAALFLLSASATLHAQDVSPAPAPATPNLQPTEWGLGTIIHPLQLGDIKLPEQVRAIPQEKKDRVHFFLINGFDPFFTANLNGLAAYCRSVGFSNTVCYQMTSAWRVRGEIEAIRRRDPQARIVLLGYSFGANLARSIANDMQADGTRLDCLIYVAGDMIQNTPDSRPPNVGKLINLTCHGAIFVGQDLFINGEDIDGAVNHRLDIHHFGIIGQRDTINLIGRELIAQANNAQSR